MKPIFEQLNETNFDSIVELEINGKKKKFEFLDIILYSSKQYLVAAPLGESFVEIFEASNIGQKEEAFIPVLSEQISFEVFEIFKKKNADEFDFDD